MLAKQMLLLQHTVSETWLIVEYCRSYIVDLKTDAHVICIEVVVACFGFFWISGTRAVPLGYKIFHCQHNGHTETCMCPNLNLTKFSDLTEGVVPLLLHSRRERLPSTPLHVELGPLSSH